LTQRASFKVVWKTPLDCGPAGVARPPWSLLDVMLSAGAYGKQWPDRPLSLIVGGTSTSLFRWDPAGGGRDIIFRVQAPCGGCTAHRRGVPPPGWRARRRRAQKVESFTTAHRIKPKARCLIAGPPGAESDFYFVGQAGRSETAVAPHPYELLEKNTHPKRFGSNYGPRHPGCLWPMEPGAAFGARVVENIELADSTQILRADRKVGAFRLDLAPGDQVSRLRNDYDREVYKR